jgi:Tfp pilus assembly protein PilF
MKGMVALAALLLAAPATAAPAAAPPPTDAQRYKGCINAIPTNPREAEQFAVEWRARGGGLPARHCQALAQMQQQRYAEAAQTLVAAAQAAERDKSPFAADFWGQAGNAALLAGDTAHAIAWLGTAIAQGSGGDPSRLAAFHVDRARAAVEQGDAAAARADLDRAMALDPKAVDAWLLSAALARRQGDIGRAALEIARASELAPDSADVMLEQGNVAAANGDLATARMVWERVGKAAPGSEAARLAARALADNPPPAR